MFAWPWHLEEYSSAASSILEQRCMTRVPIKRCDAVNEYQRLSKACDSCSCCCVDTVHTSPLPVWPITAWPIGKGVSQLKTKNKRKAPTSCE